MPSAVEGLAELGAAEVLVGLDDVAEPVDGALDTVGGQMLADVLCAAATRAAAC